MKKVVMFCGGLLMAAAMLFVSCGKDVEATISRYFSIDRANLITEEMPAATSDQEIDVVMNGNVIPGGSSFVTVITENPVSKILIGLQGETGYYEFVPERNRDYRYSFVLYVDQDIELPEGQESLEVQIAVVDEEGGISQIWETPVEIIEVGTGGLQISLTFDNAKDVDLHVIEPEYNDEYGEPVSYYSRHIYYGHRTSYNGGKLDLDSNPGCSIDNINNENITYNDSTAYIAPGEYKVYVDMYSNCDPTIPTNFVVTVFYGGALIATSTGTNPVSGIFDVDAPSTYNPITESYVEEHEPFVSFVIPDRGQGRVASFAPSAMTQSDIEKEAMSAAANK